MARILRAVLAASVATGLAVPALAQEQNQPAPQQNVPSGYPGAYQNPYQGSYPAVPTPYGAPAWQGPNPQQPNQGPVYNAYAPVAGQAPAQSFAAADPRYREMLDRCQNVGRRNRGTTGALIGGLIGGVIGGVVGNRVASAGERLLGSVVGSAGGAAVGAIAGGAIGRSGQRSSERECQEFFSSYAPPAPSYGYGYPGYGYAPGMVAPMGYVMVPVGAPQVAAQGGQGPCTETRTVTYSYEYVPVKHRYTAAPRRRPVVRDKRVRLPSGS